MTNVVINYEEVIELLRQEIELARREKEEYSNLKIIVEDERLLAKSKDRSPETMYIQIKFGAASTNFGQAVLPFSMEVIGINQDIQLTQDFLNEFVNTYNQLVVGDVSQFFLTPVVSQNNIPIYEGYRSLFIVSATFVIGNSLISITLKYKTGENTYENVECIGYNDTSEASLNPQPYPNEYGRTKSYSSFQTFAFTITTYPDSNKQLISDVYDWKFNNGILNNKTFIFSGSYILNDVVTQLFTDWEFKCKSADVVQKIGEQPVISITFTL